MIFLIILLILSILAIIIFYKKKLNQAQIFKKFVSEQFLNRIDTQGIDIRYGYKEKANLTILFSDIRSFTSFAEALEPHQLFDILNIYFTAMSECIYDNEGFIDKFIGDAIMAIFDHNLDTGDSKASAAVWAAIEMQKRLDKFNKEIKNIINIPIKTGIGIHSGEVMMGTIGFERRMDSAILGDNVNIASRIESLTKELHCKIIISETTLAQMTDKDTFQYRPLGPVRVKGREKLLNLYEVYNCDSDELRGLKQQTKSYFERGLEYFAREEWDKGEQEFKNALKIYPNDYSAKYILDTNLNQHEWRQL